MERIGCVAGARGRVDADGRGGGPPDGEGRASVRARRRRPSSCGSNRPVCVHRGALRVATPRPVPPPRACRGAAAWAAAGAVRRRAAGVGVESLGRVAARLGARGGASERAAHVRGGRRGCVCQRRGGRRGSTHRAPPTIGHRHAVHGPGTDRVAAGGEPRDARARRPIRARLGRQLPEIPRRRSVGRCRGIAGRCGAGRDVAHGGRRGDSRAVRGSRRRAGRGRPVHGGGAERRRVGLVAGLRCGRAAVPRER